MFTIQRDALTFTFPEIAGQVRSLVERKIEEFASALPPRSERNKLIEEIESNERFSKLSLSQRERASAMLRTWTPEDVAAGLRRTILELGGLNTDAFTELTVKFQRTMRIPDGGQTYSLATNLGQLPLRSVDACSKTALPSWIKKESVVLPLHRSEALWLWFSSRYRFAVKIGVGKLDALTGEPWNSTLHRQPQNYLVVPEPWWSESDEVLWHYLALPLGVGDSAIRLQVTPMSAESYYDNEFLIRTPRSIHEFFSSIIFGGMILAQMEPGQREHERFELEFMEDKIQAALYQSVPQKIPEDSYDFTARGQTQNVHGIVHPCDSSAWRQITGTNPPHPPLTADDYRQAGIPWVESYRASV